MKFKLKPGMYVSTEGVDEETYHKVAGAFMAAGCGKGEYPAYDYAEYLEAFGWRCDESESCLHHGSIGPYGFCEKITIAQALSTLEEGQEWAPVSGEDCLDADGDQVTVIATQGGWAWVKLSDAAGFLSPVSMLSPIPAKSERETAVEEMIESLPGCIQVSKGDIEVMTYLYDAGYRKQ